MSRKTNLAIYNHLYHKKSPLLEDNVCQYCGTKRDLTIEHIPPISTAHLFVRNNKIKFWKIIACRECNLLISDQLIPTFADRFFQIKDLLIKKYEKHILREFRTVNTITLVRPDFSRHLLPV